MISGLSQLAICAGAGVPARGAHGVRAGDARPVRDARREARLGQTAGLGTCVRGEAEI